MLLQLLLLLVQLLLLLVQLLLLLVQILLLLLLLFLLLLLLLLLLLRDPGLKGREEHIHQRGILGIRIRFGGRRRSGRRERRLAGWTDLARRPRPHLLPAGRCAHIRRARKEKGGRIRPLDDVLSDNGLEAVDEGGVVAGQRLQLGVHVPSRALLHQRTLLTPAPRTKNTRIRV